MSRATDSQPLFLGRFLVHPAASIFPMLDEHELAALGADIAAHGMREPVAFFDDEPEPADEDAAARLWQRKRNLQLPLLDGRNRLAAMHTAGLLTEEAIADIAAKARIIRGDPVAYVLSANLHRRHLTRDQRRELVARLLRDYPERSDRAIAAMAQVSHPTVAAVRAEMANLEDASLEATGKFYQLPEQPVRRVGLDGKARTLPTRPSEPAPAAPASQPATAEAAVSYVDRALEMLDLSFAIQAAAFAIKGATPSLAEAIDISIEPNRLAGVLFDHGDVDVIAVLKDFGLAVLGRDDIAISPKLKLAAFKCVAAAAGLTRKSHEAIAKAARKLKLAPSMVVLLTVVYKSGIPELVDLFRRGGISLIDAAMAARLPPERQWRLLADVTRAAEQEEPRGAAALS